MDSTMLLLFLVASSFTISSFAYDLNENSIFLEEESTRAIIAPAVENRDRRLPGDWLVPAPGPASTGVSCCNHCFCSPTTPAVCICGDITAPRCLDTCNTCLCGSLNYNTICICLDLKLLQCGINPSTSHSSPPSSPPPPPSLLDYHQYLQMV